MSPLFGRGSQKREDGLQPAPANWSGRLRVGPSEPSGRQPLSASTTAHTELSIETQEELYQAGEAAERRGEEPLARRYFERIARSNADVDGALPTIQLALALSKLARMTDVDGSRGAASVRYRQAAQVWDRLAAHAAAVGDAKRAGNAQQQASTARTRAEAAVKAAKEARLQLDRLRVREGGVRAGQWGRIGRA